MEVDAATAMVSFGTLISLWIVCNAQMVRRYYPVVQLRFTRWVLPTFGCQRLGGPRTGRGRAGTGLAPPRLGRAARARASFLPHGSCCPFAIPCMPIRL